jgi:uncharacterized protein YdeI (YjbR/CyaY-like superfamily)
MKTIEVRDGSQWRRRLAKHHSTESAKRADSRTRRLEKAVAMLEAGKPLGMV